MKQPPKLDPNQADIQMSLIAEYRSLQRSLQSRVQEFESLKKSLESHQERPKRNKRYSVEFSVTPEEFSVDLDYVRERSSSFFVDKGTRFHCSQIENTVRMQGTNSDGTNILCSLPMAFTTSVFDYDLRVFDSGSDREWFNTTLPQNAGSASAVGIGGSSNATSSYVPSQLLMSGLLSGFHLPRHGIIAGGTEVIVGIMPIKIGDEIYARGPYPASPLYTVVNEYILQVSFIGHEEPL